MKVSNLINNIGNTVKNQFVMEDRNNITFQSYDHIICKINKKSRKITFDKHFLNYSVTTSKHVNNFFSNEGVRFTIQDIRKENSLVTFRNLNK